MQPLVIDDVVSNAAVCQQQDILLNFEHRFRIAIVNNPHDNVFISGIRHFFDVVASNATLGRQQVILFDF